MRHALRTSLATLGLLALGAAGAAAQDDKPVVVIETSMGNIAVELDAEKAPVTVKNFLKYVDDGFYEGTIFHRVIPGFMVQGGGFTPEMREKPTNPPIPLEVGKGLSNTRGTIAMARTSVPNSATSQFFINVADNEQLDTGGGGYAVFGKVIEGMDVADKIVAVKRGSKGPHDDVPVEPIVIKSIKRKAKS
jgi:peptidyl-prolyl cis-trans isomerase A (cyclophilin A)